MDASVGQGPLVELEHVSALDRRRRELDLEVVHVVPMLVADLEDVGEAPGRDERGRGRLALDERVRDQGRGVNDGCVDLLRVDARPPERRVHAAAESDEHVRRSGERLLDDDRPCSGVDEDDVGEGAADVDGQAPVAHSR